ncbi:heptaprenylglyceryl phosphate synthase [Salinibaculum salinum]|uniref:heptaprenylglyceryl phosphate synthase n=1 Tax=Salinibaculum salinum TaxID=3131996 RepID=UPI0030EDBF48
MPALVDIVQKLDSLGTAISIGGRTLLSADTNPVPTKWDHITKVDPEEKKRLPLAYPLYLSHTGAVSVGGSQDVTEQNTIETFDLVNAATVPAFHEPSDSTHVTQAVRDKAEFMAIPEVLNGDNESLVGTLGKGVEYIRDEMAPNLIEEKLPIPLGNSIEQRLSNFAASWMLHEAVFEAYIIMNVDSAAAREANVGEEDLLTPREAKQHAMAAEHHLESELIYLEYSGTFGGEEAVEILDAIDEGVSWSRVWYGGGLDNRENAQTILDAGADAVIVGDSFHDVAEEEADLAETAVDALGSSTSREEIREWLESEVDLEDTAAARYLSTIVDVPSPEQRAARYLAAGIQIALELETVAETLSDPDAAEIRATVTDGPVPGETLFADVLDDGAAHDLAERLAVSLLAERFDVDLSDGFAAHHVAAEL